MWKSERSIYSIYEEDVSAIAEPKSGWGIVLLGCYTHVAADGEDKQGAEGEW